MDMTLTGMQALKKKTDSAFINKTELSTSPTPAFTHNLKKTTASKKFLDDLNKKPESISPIIPEAPPELPTPKVSAPTAPLPTEPVPKIPIEAKKDLKESTTSPTRKQAGTIKSPSNPVLTLRSSRGGTTSSSTARIRAFAYDDEDDKIKSPKSPKLEELFQALEKKDDKKESEHKYKDKSPEDYKHKEEKKQKKEKKEKKDDKEKKRKKKRTKRKMLRRTYTHLQQLVLLDQKKVKLKKANLIH